VLPLKSVQVIPDSVDALDIVDPIRRSPISRHYPTASVMSGAPRSADIPRDAQATISSENNALGLSMSDEQYELIALVVERIDAFETGRQLGKSLQPIETK
jgi:hypothetical protein